MTHRCCHLMNKVENTDSTPDILYRPTMQWAVGGHLQAREMFPQNCHFPHLKNVSLGPPESTPQTASQSVQPFYHSWRLRPTDTDHTTSVTIGRILCFAQRCKFCSLVKSVENITRQRNLQTFLAYSVVDSSICNWQASRAFTTFITNIPSFIFFFLWIAPFKKIPYTEYWYVSDTLRDNKQIIVHHLMTQQKLK